MTANGMTRPRVQLTVVIPTYNRRDALQRALAALERQSALGSFEVVVSVDGSDDGTVEMLERLQPPYPLHVVADANRGRAAARNAAIRLAGGDIVHFLDDDMEPTPDCVAAHLAAHLRHPRACVLGPVPFRDEDRATPLAAYFAEKFDEHLARLAAAEGGFILRDFYSGNASVPRGALLAAGLFDEGLAGYGNEDVELWHRLRCAGLQLTFEPSAVALQGFDKNFRRAAQDATSAGRAALYVAAKHPEAVGELRLAAASRARLPWRAFRGALVWASHATGLVPAAVIALTGALERAHVRRLRLYYRLALDYFFWLGITGPTTTGRRLR